MDSLTLALKANSSDSGQTNAFQTDIASELTRADTTTNKDKQPNGQTNGP